MGSPLTWQLTNETPLRRWFSTRLPHIEAVPSGPPARLRPVVPRRRPDALPPWLIGAAFDWRIRLGLEIPKDPASTTAYAGWLLTRPADACLAPGGPAADTTGSTGGLAADPVTGLLGHARLHGGGRALTVARDELELARVSVALARYEACYRDGGRAGTSLRGLGGHPSIGELVSLCPDEAADELVRLTAAARRGLAPLFPTGVIETNPEFTALGIPADGDLVVDGILLELKTVTRPRLERHWLWQLLGYVFLDGGRRGIDRVGVYLSRHAWLQCWGVDDLASVLAGGAVTERQLRREFRAAAAGRGASS